MGIIRSIRRSFTDSIKVYERKKADCLQLMICFVVALLTYSASAALEFSSFNTRTNLTAVHQVNESCVLIGGSKGELIYYSLKGQMLGEVNSVHRKQIVGIETVNESGSIWMASADDEGVITVWNQDHSHTAQINLHTKIYQIEQSADRVLAVNLGHQIQFYSLPILTHLRTVSIQEGIVSKMSYSGNKLYYLQDRNTHSLIYSDNTQESEVILERKSRIYDFAIHESQQSIIIYLINAHNHLQISQINANRYSSPNLSNMGQQSQQQSLILSSNYSSVTLLRNSLVLPMFAALKSAHQLQIFTSTTVSTFLQFNSDIQTIISTYNDSLLLATHSSLTIIRIYQQQEGHDLWILVFILILLAAGLYLCCGDCCPGIYEKYVAQRERREIQMELYKKRSQLDHF